MNDLLAAGSSGGVVVAIILALIEYIRDRKSAKAKGAIDQRTVQTKVDDIGLANLDRRLTLLARAHDEENEARQGTINAVRADLGEALTRISELERRLEFIDARYRAAIRYIRALRTWITRQLPNHDAPPVPAALEAEFDD
jgi:hypothetical protein